MGITVQSRRTLSSESPLMISSILSIHPLFLQSFSELVRSVFLTGNVSRVLYFFELNFYLSRYIYLVSFILLRTLFWPLHFPTQNIGGTGSVISKTWGRISSLFGNSQNSSSLRPRLMRPMSSYDPTLLMSFWSILQRCRQVGCLLSPRYHRPLYFSSFRS